MVLFLLNDMEYPSIYECVTDETSTICTVTATTTGNNITYYDWLFISGVEIFILSFFTIGMIFSLFKTRK